MMKNQDSFKFYVPCDIEKAADSSGKEVMRFKGIASTSEQDSQGEFLDPSGFDLSSFKYVNYNHHGSKDPATIIGEPTKAVITKDNQFYVEGILFPEVSMAKSTWSLMKALQNSKSGNKLGISVEGKAIARGCGPEFLDEAKTIKNPSFSLSKWNRITKARITSIALCPVPINGGTWADIMKGEMPDDEEEYDEETQKALTAEAGEFVTSKEDVETEKNKKRVSLKKGEVFEKIFDLSPSITIEKAKSVYLLIERIANMNTEKEIKDETISKAFEILDLASDAISKAAKDADKLEKEKKDKEEEDEDEKEMVKKASSTCKVMKAEGKDKEMIKAAMLKKGYGEKVIEKAMKEDPTEEKKEESVSKSEIAEIFKAETESLVKSFDDKFKSLGTILKHVTEENGEIKKSLESSLVENKELKDKLTTILSQPVGGKSIISKSYSTRFGDEKAEGSKSNRKFNIKNASDRITLKNIVTELSGINKGDGQFDVGLTQIASEIEITKSLSPSSLGRLKAMEFEIVAE